MCCCVAACSVYRPNLLDVSPRPKSAGLSGGTGGNNGTAGHSGLDASVHDAGDDASKIMSGKPEGGVSQTVCGDGLVTGQEKCDTAIESGKPGSCPMDCPALGPCTPRALNGSGCTSECVLVQVSCMNGDGCCPGGCSHATDSDCSASCGDKIVEKDLGETCEQGTDTPCPTLADCNDQNACTLDSLTGGAEGCNAACKHDPVTTPVNGDGCCPNGANANSDNDCQPTCGNGVAEPGEQCDGSQGCSSDCKLTLQPDQMRCLSTYASNPDMTWKDPTKDCDACSCINCVGTNQYLACRDIDVKAHNTDCEAVLMCAMANNCTGTPCYCGTADQLSCGLGPSGPCTQEIEAAAGAQPGDWVTVTNARQMTGSTLNVAYSADTCRVSNCRSVCRPTAP